MSKNSCNSQKYATCAGQLTSRPYDVANYFTKLLRYWMQLNDVNSTYNTLYDWIGLIKTQLRRCCSVFQMTRLLV